MYINVKSGGDEIPLAKVDRRKSLPPMSTQSIKGKLDLFKENLQPEDIEIKDSGLTAISKKTLANTPAVEAVETEVLDKETLAERISSHPLFVKSANRILSWRKGRFEPIAKAIEEFQNVHLNEKLTETELTDALIHILHACNHYYEEHKSHRRTIAGARRKTRVKEMTQAIYELLKDSEVIPPNYRVYVYERLACDKSTDGANTVLAKADYAKAGKDYMLEKLNEIQINDCFSKEQKDGAIAFINKCVDADYFRRTFMDKRNSGKDEDGKKYSELMGDLAKISCPEGKNAWQYLLKTNGIDIRGFKHLLKPCHFNLSGEPDTRDDYYIHEENKTLLMDMAMVKEGENGELLPDVDNEEKKERIFNEHVSAILNFPITKDMLSYEYTSNNMEAFINISYKYQEYIESITITNRRFYDRLPERVKQQIKVRLDMLLSYSAFARQYMVYMSSDFTMGSFQKMSDDPKRPDCFKQLKSIMEKVSQGAKIQFEYTRSESREMEIEGGNGKTDLGKLYYSGKNPVILNYARFYQEYQYLFPLIDTSVSLSSPELSYIPPRASDELKRETENTYKLGNPEESYVEEFPEGLPDNIKKEIPKMYFYYLGATKRARKRQLMSAERQDMDYENGVLPQLLEKSGFFRDESLDSKVAPSSVGNELRKKFTDDYLARMKHYLYAKSNDTAYNEYTYRKYPFLREFKTGEEFVNYVEHDEDFLMGILNTLIYTKNCFDEFNLSEYSNPAKDVEWVDHFEDYAGKLEGLLKDPTYLAMGLPKEQQNIVDRMIQQVNEIRERMDSEIEKSCGLTVDSYGVLHYSPRRIDNQASLRSKKDPLYFMREQA